MPASAVSLSDVPDAYFDPTLWASFLDAFGDMGSADGKAEALHVLGMTNDGFLEYANEELADRRDAVGERARRRLVGYDLKRLLLTELRRRLVVGELLGSGISPSGERSAIAGELWDDLKFDFVRNTASSKDFNFVRVFVAEAVLRPVDLVAECEQWLRLQRRSNALAETLGFESHPTTHAWNPLTTIGASRALHIVLVRLDFRPAPAALPTLRAIRWMRSALGLGHA